MANARPEYAYRQPRKDCANIGPEYINFRSARRLINRYMYCQSRRKKLTKRQHTAKTLQNANFTQEVCKMPTRKPETAGTPLLRAFLDLAPVKQKGRQAAVMRTRCPSGRTNTPPAGCPAPTFMLLQKAFKKAGGKRRKGRKKQKKREKKRKKQTKRRGKGLKRDEKKRRRSKKGAPNPPPFAKSLQIPQNLTNPLDFSSKILYNESTKKDRRASRGTNTLPCKMHKHLTHPVTRCRWIEYNTFIRNWQEEFSGRVSELCSSHHFAWVGRSLDVYGISAPHLFCAPAGSRSEKSLS